MSRRRLNVYWSLQGASDTRPVGKRIHRERLFSQGNADVYLIEMLGAPPVRWDIVSHMALVLVQREGLSPASQRDVLRRPRKPRQRKDDDPRNFTPPLL